MPTIASVQALRAIAALAVTFCHFDQLRRWLAGFHEPYALERLSSGVDLFFVISGFVMVYASVGMFATRGAAFTFAIKRVSRIAPIYWATTLISIPLMATAVNGSWLTASLLFIPFRTPSDNISPVYGVGWTLNFEMFFYALFAAIIFLPRAAAVASLTTVMLAFVGLGVWLAPVNGQLASWSDPIILEFVFGMLLAHLYLNGTRLPVWIRIGLVVAGVAAISLSTAQMSPSGWRVVQWGIPAAMIFAGTVLGREINFGPFRGLVTLLGDSSYALYLLHCLVTAAIFRAWPLGLNQYPRLEVLAVGIIVAQMLAIALYTWCERPVTKLLQRRLLGERWSARSGAVS